MTTSLANQLRLLKTPQTSILFDKKKRTSILFEPTDAATKDRETIFDIGYSGLEELIAINPTFKIFESTLFDRNARDMQRAVESKEVNAQLDETIKKFFVHLSPYLLLQPAHKCLEWLFRRFNIHEYNKNELMMLIFPYHETKIFVKCLQTMQLSDRDDKWNWLQKIQSPGVPLSKQAVLNRAASDGFFLKFICESVVYAAKELEAKANSLQVFYAFYCTTVIGALELAKIDESHISSILFPIDAGLKSISIDFCAASIMVVSQLVNKVKLSEKVLQHFVKKLLEIPHLKLQTEAVLVLVLIYRSQREIIQSIPDDYAAGLLKRKWIASVLAQIYNEGISILPFYIPLLSWCLKMVQTENEHWTDSRRFSEILLSECLFKANDATEVIRCVLESCTVSKLPNNSLINIESDNEDEKMEESHECKYTAWYINLLKSLERRYSSTFDEIVKETLCSQNQSFDESKKNSLRVALAFLFSFACTEDNVNLFEKLYHYNAQHRTNAVKFLVKNLEKLTFSGDLLKDCISERLSDESPIVVNETLKFETSQLKKTIGKQVLQKKLTILLERSLAQPSIWDTVELASLRHLTSAAVCNASNCNEILMSVLPFLLQSSLFNTDFVRQILNSSLAKYVPFIQKCKGLVTNVDEKEVLFQEISNEFEKKRGLPSTEDILKTIATISDDEFNVNKAFYAVLLLGYSVGSNCSPESCLQILEVIHRCESRLNLIESSDSTKWMAHAAMGEYPLNLNVGCIKNIANSINSKQLNELDKIDFATPSLTLSLAHKLFEYVINNVSSHRPERRRYNLYMDALHHLLKTLFKTREAQKEFLSNYFIVDALNTELNMNLKTEAQATAIAYMNAYLTDDDDFAKAPLTLHAFIRILSGLRSKNASIRGASFETLAVLSKRNDNQFSPLIKKLIKRKDEILMDENQLALILFSVFEKPSKDLKLMLNEFINFITTNTTHEFLVALLLEVLTHVNTNEILKTISCCALSILDKANSLLYNFDTKTMVLDKSKSIILRNILSRYTQQTIKAMQNDVSGWETFLKSIQYHGIFLKENTTSIPVTSYSIELINEDLFNALSAENQRETLKAAITSATYTEHIDLNLMINKLFKQISINGQICVDILNAMAAVSLREHMDVNEADTLNVTEKLTQSKNLVSSKFVPLSTEVLKLKDWKRGITLMEFLQNKQNVTNAYTLLPSLFVVLRKCLEFEEQTSIEYAKQLVLSCIWHLCVITPSTARANQQKSQSAQLKNAFKIELVVQCIRSTQNPQTHHQALQLLAHAAHLIPDQVLHNMMEIFTFMGSSVIRHDDAYSFQVIKNIITSVIPTLVRANEDKNEVEQLASVVPVLRVFSDILLDVPEHRRIPLYVNFLETLGVNDHLWMFLTVIIEAQLLHSDEGKQKLEHNLSKQSQSLSTLPRRIEIALTLAKQFSCQTIVHTITKMVEFLQRIPIHKPTNNPDKIPANVSNLLNVNTFTEYQLQKYKYTYLKFLNNLSSSVEFVNKIAQLNEEEVKQMKPFYQNAIIKVLTFVPEVSRNLGQQDPSDLYWKAMLHYCYEILGNIVSLLSADTFLVVIHGLLSHKLSSVRRKVIEILMDKLQYQTEFFAGSDKDNLVKLLGPLSLIMESIVNDGKAIQISENIVIQQMSLVAIKLLSKLLGKEYPEKFKDILETLLEILRNSDKIPRLLLANTVLSSAEIFASLRAHSIVCLPSFMKIILSNLQIHTCTESTLILGDNVLICLVAAIQKIVNTLPRFLSPYLVNLIVRLSRIWDKITKYAEKDAMYNALLTRLNAIWGKLSVEIQMRVLIPTIQQSYETLAREVDGTGVGPLMQLLSKSFEEQPVPEISEFMSEITTMFLNILQFRSDHADLQLATVNALEDKIIEAFVALTLKLSEGKFRPLYCSIYNWAFRSDETEHNRALTFFRLSSAIAKSLKTLFVLFTNDFIPNAATLLTNLTVLELPNNQNQLAQSSLLVFSIVETLYQVFLHNSHSSVNSSRFEVLVQPLVDQIENALVLNDSNTMDLVSQAITQLGVAFNDDIQWKQLNYQVLMKTRNNSSSIRLFALKVCVEMATKLGEDYLPLVPETVPFLSELLEDENPEVEEQCQRSVQELEKILGEPLQKYF